MPMWPQGPNSMGIKKSYLEFMRFLGAAVIPLSLHQFADENGNVDPERIVETCNGLDMLLLPGGLDVNPMRYGAIPEFYTQNPNVHLEFFDERILPYIIERTSLPIAGICRGFQTLSVHFGGKIDQDYNHPISEPRSKSVEKLVFTEEAFGIFPELRNRAFSSEIKKQGVNSLHHQHVEPESLNGRFMPIALSDTTGTTEVASTGDGRIVAFQYHPEEIYDPFSIYAFGRLLNGKDEPVEFKSKSVVEAERPVG